MNLHRIKVLRRVLKEQKIDALLVTNFYNILYLTDFKGLSPDEREAYGVVTRDKAYLLTDGRYLTEKLKVDSARFAVECRLIDYKNNLVTHLKKIAEEEKVKMFGFEAEDLKVAEYSSFKEKLEVKLVPTSKLVNSLRVIKDTTEIEAIRKASNLTDQCLREIVEKISVGVSEKEITHRIEFWIKRKGYDLAFEPIIVAVDKNSTIPHYDTRTGHGVVKKGSVILIDFGVKYKNYISDITRMFFVGTPTPEVVQTYNALLAVQEKTIAQITRGARLQDIDAFCRKELEKNRLPNFPHGTGHGIGLEIHEEPRVSPHVTSQVTEGQVFTIEPGVYREGKWGMRIEDSVVIQNGKAQILTKFSKKLIVL